jgi:uncharacterized protein YjeT (DUF2065 family)
MSFFLLLVSLVLIIKGVSMILVPKKTMKFAAQMLKVKEPRLWGLSSLFVGILLLFAASHCILVWLIVLLGLMEISKAVYVFLSPPQMLFHWSSNLKENAYRVWGIWSLVLGVIIFITRI